MKYLLIGCLLFSNSAIAGADVMTQDEMEKIVISNVDVEEYKKGYVLFTYNKVKMALISDTNHDRMRIISPITQYSALTTEVKDVVMESNFHLALDARYAVRDDVLYSAFIHPMSPLTQQELEAALKQVSTLVLTFGTSYSSGELSFSEVASTPGK